MQNVTISNGQWLFLDLDFLSSFHTVPQKCCRWKPAKTSSILTRRVARIFTRATLC